MRTKEPLVPALVTTSIGSLPVKAWNDSRVPVHHHLDFSPSLLSGASDVTRSEWRHICMTLTQLPCHKPGDMAANPLVGTRGC